MDALRSNILPQLVSAGEKRLDAATSMVKSTESGFVQNKARLEAKVKDSFAHINKITPQIAGKSREFVVTGKEKYSKTEASIQGCFDKASDSFLMNRINQKVVPLKSYIDHKIKEGIQSGRNPESAEKELMADQEAAKVIPLALKHLTAGKGKNVAIDENEAPDTRKYVYYSPVGEVHHVSDSIKVKSMGYMLKENELNNEVKTAEKILKILPPGRETNLALEMEEVGGLIRAPFAAGGNLDKAAKSGELKFPDSMRIAGNVLNGIANLHSTGHVHKDLKNEQVLLFKVDGKLIARLSDWGKTTLLENNKSVKSGNVKKWIKEKVNTIHSGNPRCAAPEGGASFSGETFSAAVMMIGVLEGQFLKGKGKPGEEGYVPDKDMLIQPENWDEKAYSDIEKADKRFGFEKFLVVNKNCTQTENTTLRGNIKIIGKEIRALAGKPSASDLRKSEVEAYKYIDALTDKLIENSPDLKDEILEMGGLLKSMTRSKVGEGSNCRISSAEANVKWEEIRQKMDL